MMKHREERRARTRERKREKPDRAPKEAPETEQFQHEAAETDQQATGTWADINQAPSSWTKEARSHWNSVPERVRREIWKRETDVQRGIDQFKQQHQEIYGQIDQAMAPYDATLRQFGKTRGQAIAQFWGWFDALAKNPDAAFPALAQSYNYNPERLAGNLMRGRGWHIQQTPQGGFYVTRNPQAQYQQQLNGQIQQAVAPLYQYFEQQQRAYQQQVEQVNAENTERMLTEWAKDRPHFQQVRKLMGTLLTPDQNTGEAPVPLTPEGLVDLETAYQMAVDATITPKQRQRAERYQEKADRARRTASSIAPSAPGPGSYNGRGDRPKKGMSVRDSIEDAIR